MPWRQIGPPVWAPYAPGLATDQITLKHELFERCMEAKGYQLMPEKAEEGIREDQTQPATAGASESAEQPESEHRL